MRSFHLKTIILCIAISSFTKINAQNPVAYMEKMNKEFVKLSEETWDYTRAVAHNKKAKQIENRRKEMLSANRTALNKVKNMQPYNGSSAFRDSVARYLELSYLVLNNDYSKIVDMEEIAEQSYDAMEAYMTAQQIANDKLEDANIVMQMAQKKFAAENNINLIDSESSTEQKLEKASEVFKFYNELYLIFFKPYKQEMYLIAALDKGDVNAMKQNQESLSKLSKEAKEKIKGVKQYKNNTTLKAACNDMMDFYIYEADTKISSLVDFHMKKEKFEKLKTAMDKKGQSSSKQEVDEYNAAINEYNKAGSEFNNVNNDLNKKRADNLNNWNNAVSKFLDRNVSKKK